MMFDIVTDRARTVVARSQKEAERLNHDYIGTEHLLLGLLKEGSGVGITALSNLGVDPKKVRQEIEKIVTSGAKNSSRGPLPFTPQAKHVLECASIEARTLGHPCIGSEHILLGLLSDET